MTPEALAEAMEQTWPPARSFEAGPWCLRDGQGGGKRVSAATARPGWRDEDIPAAEAAMAAMGQPPLFCIRAGDDLLDQALQARGYRVVDPVLAYGAACADLALPPAPPMAAFAHWPPLAICAEIWEEGGISPARLAVMQRATGPKCAVLGRVADRPAGVAFVAIHQDIALLHALEVRPQMRRQGSAHNILRAAAGWAQQNGATQLCLAVTVANTGARKLYASLNMQIVGEYHYRQR
ncbi:N-acetyltransferase [Pseudorhodobacter sp. MZDSW-24AT]|uniref:GNAT family N-acetyltransferase n=1 Tax=Pseudorhodobacter sp. MZDSW-24AT TaxID=2052957 RepID=UPI000C1DF57F|nr:GNAT family N-acetyltransferase [Pseudorhodobacter sp. MZDSW-24AT]PJF09821.1 GNAT family N-acetyltransferase [Pseudorhodobacter sp. MZDSW-24AT]